MISVGNSRRQENTLERTGVLSLSNVKDSDAMNRIKVIKKDNIDTNIEIVDLIEGKLYDIKSFEYSRINPIEYNRIYPIMKHIYNKRKDTFKIIFGDEL